MESDPQDTEDVWGVEAGGEVWDTDFETPDLFADDGDGGGGIF